jgi:site-specific recombinase XerD
MAATWLAGYRSARTRRAYAGDLAAWLDWLAARHVDVLEARRIHVDLWTRGLLDAGAAHSSVARRLSALTSWYRHLGEHDLIATNPAAAVRRPKVDPDHTNTVGLDRDQARALLIAADTDTGPAQLRTAAAIRLLLHQGLRVDELAHANVADLGHDRGHRTLTVTRKGGRRIALVLPPATTAALDTYLASRAATAAMTGVASVATSGDRVAGRASPTSADTPAAGMTGPLLATSTGGRLDQAAFWHLVRRLARAAGIEHWAALSPHSLRHTSITLALDAGATLRDVQDFAGHRDPRTTRRYDRSRHSLDRNAAYTLAAYLA